MPVQFDDKEFTFKQPDGHEIKVKGWGDQFYAVFETLDGYTIIENPSSGFYEYAKLSEDKNRLEPTGAKVDAVDPATLGLAKHIRVSKDASREIARAASDRMISKTRWHQRREEARSELKTALKEERAPRLEARWAVLLDSAFSSSSKMSPVLLLRTKSKTSAIRRDIVKMETTDQYAIISMRFRMVNSITQTSSCPIKQKKLRLTIQIQKFHGLFEL